MSISPEKLQELQAKMREAVSDYDGAEIGIPVTRQALDDGVTPVEFFQEVISPVVEEVGDQFAKLEIFLPELMVAGMVIKQIQEQVLEPAIKADQTGSGSMGKVVIGTCQGDLHDIGKDMVALMLQVNGFEVVDIGTDNAPQKFIDAAKSEKADIIAMSALLTPSVPYISDVSKLLKGFGMREQYKIIVGGAAVTQQWVEKNDVDGYGRDAVEAVEICRTIMKAQKEG
jgi:methylmalonyl-CoA mutase cobalamin-binding domain/chain